MAQRLSILTKSLLFLIFLPPPSLSFLLPPTALPSLRTATTKPFSFRLNNKRNYGSYRPLSSPVVPKRQDDRPSSWIRFSSSDSDSENPASLPKKPLQPIETTERLTEYANDRGVVLSLTTLGPAYRAVARPKHDEEQILGYCEGFVRPGGKILHVDKLEVWKKALLKAESTAPSMTTTTTNTNTTTQKTFQKSAGTTFGISLLLGYLCLLHGRSNSCTKAEFLAIDDEEFQHKRLVRFFRRAGFRIVKYVGEGLGDVPDRLIWGGCGTLMERDLEGLLVEWTAILFRDK